MIDDVISEHNGLGYSGTNSGGNLLHRQLTFSNNRAGIVPNSGSYELCYPQRQTTIVGNIVYSNNQPDTPAIDVAILAMGNGILIAGGSRQRDRTKPRVRPRQDRHRPRPVPRGGPERRTCRPRTTGTVDCADPARAGARGRACPRALLWDPWDNAVVGNDVSDKRVADLGVAGVGVDTSTLAQLLGRQHCSRRRRRPTIETLAPVRRHRIGRLERQRRSMSLSWLADAETNPPSVDYQTATAARHAGRCAGMDDPENAPVEPADVPPRRSTSTAIVRPGKAGRLTCAASRSLGLVTGARRRGGVWRFRRRRRWRRTGRVRRARRPARRSIPSGSGRRGGSRSSSCSARSAMPPTTTRSSTRISRG